MPRSPVPVRRILVAVAAALTMVTAGGLAPAVAVAAPAAALPAVEAPTPDAVDDVPQAADAPAPGVAARNTGPGTRAAGGVASTAGAQAVPVLRSTFDVKGGYVAAGVGMRNRGFGTVNLKGIPTGAVAFKAYLYWTIFNPTEAPAFKAGKVNGKAITGVRVGTGAQPCWNAGQGYAYRADVTALVKKNGAYKLTGFASGQTDGADPFVSGSALPMADGASLVVVYKKETAPAYPQTRVRLFDGYQETEAAPVTLNAQWGFPASNPVGDVRTTFITADGQSATEPGATINGAAVPAVDLDGTDPQTAPSFSQGNLWDTDTVRAGKLVRPGDTGATITMTGGPDCLVWVGQALSIANDGAADTDGDKLLDGWEANGLDADGNGTVDVDLPTFNANPVHKDIFVEMDYMGAEAACPCRLPLAADLARIVAVFKAAPFGNNPNGLAGITMHLDAGAARGATYDLGGGNLVADDPVLNPVDPEFNAIKSANFNVNRSKVFHYMVWANLYGTTTSSGLSFGIPADSFIVTLAAFPGGGDSNAKVGTFIHELGHGLGLGHGGNEGTNYKPNYLSVMSYAFQLNGTPRTGGLPADFGYSSSNLPALAEGALNEATGLASTAADTYRTTWFCPNGVLTTSPGTANGPLDWNCDGTAAGTVASDVNRDGVSSTLTGFQDWANLVYDGGTIGNGNLQRRVVQPPPAELTLEEYQRTHR